MIWRLSGWSSTTKMRLLMPFPPAARLRLHSRERADENAFETPPVPVSAMPLLHTLRVQRRAAQELFSTCRLHLSLDNDREPEGKSRALARLRLDPDLPPCISIMRFDMASPKPVPPFFRVMALSAC